MKVLTICKCSTSHIGELPGFLDSQFKGKNVSDQPTTCPLCGAILRQSRNLRRHLELLHFGAGNSGTAGIRVRRRKTDFRSPTMVPRPTLHSLRMEHTQRRPTENSDFPTASIASSLAGNLMSSTPDMNDSTSNTSSATIASTLNNGIYPTDSSAMLSCLIPNLPTLPPLPSSHDVFRHSEILRAGIAYHDSSRQHAKQFQRTDVT